MIFEIYFKSAEEAEKATLYQKFSNLITEYRGGNYFTIELPDIGKNAKDTLQPLIKSIYPNGEAIDNNFISPRMSTHITMKVSYPIRFTVWDTDKFISVTL